MPYKNPFAQMTPSQPTFRNPFTSDSISSIRQRNILTPSFQANSYEPQQDEGQAETDRYYGAYQNILNQQTPNLDAWKGYLQQTPKMEDYAPSGMTRFAAALSGASAGMRDPAAGVKVANDINTNRYRNAITDYATRGAGMKDLAAMEDTDKNERVKALMDARNFGLKYKEYQSKAGLESAQAAAAGTNAEGSLLRGQAAKTTADSAAAGTYTAMPVVGGYMLVNNKDPRKNIMSKGKTIQEAQSEAQRISANAAMTGAMSGSRRVDLDEDEFDYNSSFGQPTKGSATNNRPISGSEQENLANLVYDDMGLLPLTRKFMTQQGSHWIPRQDMSASEAMQFKSLYDAKMRERSGYRGSR